MEANTRLPLFKVANGEDKPGIDFAAHPRYREYLKAVYDYNGNLTAAEIQHLVPPHEPTERQKAALKRAHKAAKKKREAQLSLPIGTAEREGKSASKNRTAVSRTVRNHLAKLHHNGYLRRYGQKNTVLYTLGPKAAEPLVLHYDADPKRIEMLQGRVKEATSYYFEHSRMISRIHFMTEMALRNTPVSLAWWKHDGEIKIDVWFTGSNQKRRRVPVLPDAYFALAMETGTAEHFFLEADRTTSTRERFSNKVLAYYHFWKRHGKRKQPRCEEELQIQHFRVLAVCVSTPRLQGLYESAQKALNEDPAYKQAYRDMSKKGLETAPSGISFVHEDAWRIEDGYAFPDLNTRFIPFV